MQIKRISAATTLDAAIDDVILVDASAGNVTVTIPAGVATGRTFTIKRVDTNPSNTVMISFADGTVDDTDTLISVGNKVTYKIITEGANKWQTISRF